MEQCSSCVCEKGGGVLRSSAGLSVAGESLQLGSPTARSMSGAVWIRCACSRPTVNIAQVLVRKEVRFKEFGSFSCHVSTCARWQESSWWKCQRLCLEIKKSSKDCSPVAAFFAAPIKGCAATVWRGL